LDADHDDHDLWLETVSIERESPILPWPITSRFGNIAWPARSPDLFATDWRHLKTHLSARKPRTFGELKKHTRTKLEPRIDVCCYHCSLLSECTECRGDIPAYSMLNYSYSVDIKTIE
jgi:hypothetical protein